MTTEAFLSKILGITEQAVATYTRMVDDAGTPMDGDEVDDLCELIKLEMNFNQGNITHQEYLMAKDDLQILKALS